MMADEDYRCDYSMITIPNDPLYIGVATAYVDAVSQKMGFDSSDRARIHSAVAEAVSNVMAHAYEPTERASLQLGCERVPMGLKISIRDKGIPFDPSQANQCAIDPTTSDLAPNGCGISFMKELMDEVQFNNLGPDGKETVLVKYLQNKSITDYYEACDLRPYQESSPQTASAHQPEIAIRHMNASEAVEVSRCVYRSYGYSYSNEKAYYPDQLIQLNASGQIYSAVAVTPTGEVVGHCALLRSARSPRIAELGMAVVKPEFRSRRIFSKITEFLVKKAKSLSLVGLFGRAVSNHTFSQALAHRLGLEDCAILLGHLPQTASFKGITEKLPQRETLIVHFAYLFSPPNHLVYPPPRHLDMIKRLYANMHLNPTVKAPDDASTYPLPNQSVVKTSVNNSLGFARIDLERFGQDAAREVKKRLRELCLQRIDTINLYLDLLDPSTPVFAPTFEEFGFFFAGIFPAERRGDALIMQYLNNVPIDYTKIKLEGQSGKDLLSYIRQNDPSAT